MKILLHMISTVNGYIADPHGETVSTPPDWREFDDNTKRYNNFVVGRKTFNVVGEKVFDSTPCEHKVILSSQKTLNHGSAYTFVSTPQEAIRYLESKGVDTLFLVGGGKINSAFAKDNLIDEVIVIVKPSLIGRGIPLFSPEDFDLPLKFQGVDELSDGRVRLRYDIVK